MAERGSSSVPTSVGGDGGEGCVHPHLTLRVPSGRQRQVHNEQLSLKILARRVGGVRDAVWPSPAHDHCGKPEAPTPRKLQTDFFFKENEFYFYNQNILIKIF